jgi:hypothetical protein
VQHQPEEVGDEPAARQPVGEQRGFQVLDFVFRLARIIHETSSRKLGFRSELRTRPEQRSEAH